MLTRANEAKMMGISERTFRRWRKSGKFPADSRASLCWCGRLIRMYRNAEAEAEAEDGCIIHDGICECGLVARSVQP